MFIVFSLYYLRFCLFIVLSLFYIRFRLDIVFSPYYLRLSYGHCIVSVLLTALVCSLCSLCTTYGFRLVIVLSVLSSFIFWSLYGLALFYLRLLIITPFGIFKLFFSNNNCVFVFLLILYVFFFINIPYFRCISQKGAFMIIVFIFIFIFTSKILKFIYYKYHLTKWVSSVTNVLQKKL